jgi:hypothetical protein
MKYKYLSVLSVMAILVGGQAYGADYIDGLAAYVRGDFKTACREFQTLAEAGNVKAQIKLGEMAVKEECGKENADAVKWFTMAAEQKSAEAMLNLGLMYSAGKGVTQSDTEAAKWYRLAAEQGNAAGQWMFGKVAADGKGVPQNDAEAVKWYRKAAEQGNAAGQRLLGERYGNGAGVEKDYVKAYMWLTLAFERGDTLAADIRFKVSGKMSPEQIAEAKKQAAQWQPVKSRNGK